MGRADPGRVGPGQAKPGRAEPVGSPPGGPLNFRFVEAKRKFGSPDAPRAPRASRTQSPGCRRLAAAAAAGASARQRREARVSRAGKLANVIWHFGVTVKFDTFEFVFGNAKSFCMLAIFTCIYESDTFVELVFFVVEISSLGGYLNARRLDRPSMLRRRMLALGCCNLQR